MVKQPSHSSVRTHITCARGWGAGELLKRESSFTQGIIIVAT